jgi:hypothetical protein
MATQAQDKEQEITVEISASEDDIEVAVQDDTPEEDRGREPLPEDIVKELEADELEDYSEKVKTRLKQMKKVWHDERRAKESADRERAEAITLAQRLVEENKKLKAKTAYSETALVASFKEAAGRQLKEAQLAYKEAFDSGDSDRVVEAQQALNAAQSRAAQAERYKAPTLQNEDNELHNQHQQAQPQPVVQRDTKATAWQERNQWFGKHRLMTAMALGLHEELVEKHGAAYATTDEYYDRIDKTMRSKFPEEFTGETQTGGGKPGQRANRPATVVAPVSRSTAPKKVVLTESQVRLAKRLGVTPEQYAREFVKQENRNG